MRDGSRLPRGSGLKAALSRMPRAVLVSKRRTALQVCWENRKCHQNIGEEVPG